MNASAIPAIVLGGTGYVAGEILRLLVQHPQLEIHGILSESQSGASIASVFPNLGAATGKLQFVARETLLNELPAGRVALFSAAPHGASAALIAEFLAAAGGKTQLSVVDVSADFRYADAAAYEAVYGQPHGAPELLSQFSSALPEHLASSETPHIGHPGCFASALLLAAVPLLELGISDGDLHASGVTGSTGSGRSPTATTHHPERHSNLFAYKPLAHRHSPEVVGVCETLTGTRPALHFVPHSGPFARGVHMTVQTRLAKPLDTAALYDAFSRFYAGSEFVQVIDGMPRIKDVAGSNYAHLGVASDGRSAAVMVAIDNLVKGAAGGAMQWMNRLLGLPENAGLTSPAVAWT